MKALSCLPLVLISALILAPGTADAQQHRGHTADHWYAGLGGGRAELRESLDEDTRFDDAVTGRKAFIGTRGEVLGFELSAVRFDTFSSEEDNGASVGLQGRTLSATLQMPLDPRFAVYARWGRFWWRADGDGSDELPDGSGRDRYRGLGAIIRVSPRIDVLLEYERYRAESIDPRMTSLSVALRF